MEREVKILKIKGRKYETYPLVGVFTVRGYRKGKKAKAAKCEACGEEIQVNEQYIRIGGEFAQMFCLGCVEY